MKNSLLILFCFICCTMSANAALTATATVTPSQCPATGVITVNASGGTQPYLYSLSGTVIMSGQASNVFSALPVGTYSATVTDNAGATITVNNIVVGSNYINMNPTATATTEVCGGSNTGSIKLSLPSAQGTSPYTYQIVSGPTSQAPATGITTLSYTFQNLAPGSYRMSVTDACGLVQARDVVLAAGPKHNDDISVWAYSSADCSTTDYYVQPQIGAYYPHTYYAYPNGDLSQTPYTITFTGSQLVATPSNGQAAFKWTLPTPSPWMNGKYAFKYTDICNTDVNSASVHTAINTLGDYQITTSLQSCTPTMTVTVLNGWELNASLTSPVTVTITPQSGGSSITQTITDPNIRATTFNVRSGVTYNITIADACPSHRPITTTRTISFTKDIGKWPGCGSDIDGLTGYSWTFGNGWQYPVTATFLSGPTTYHSTLYNQDITATYPVTFQPFTNGMIYVHNLVPGTYSVEFKDGCNDSIYSLVVPNSNLTSYNFPAITTGGCAGSQTFTLSASSTCQNIATDLRKSPNQVIANGTTATWTQPNVTAGATYIVYYYTAKYTNEVFVNPNTYGTNNIFLKKDSVVIPVLSSYPSVASSGFAQCSSGSLQVTLNKTASSPNISTYSIEKTVGQGDYYAPQTSNIFTITDYGVHAYKITDVCGNAGTGFIDVEPPTFLTSAPAAICSGTKFTATFTPAPANATISWSNSLGESGTGNIDEILTNTSSAPITVTYTVLANSTTGCSSGSQLIIVTVNPIPVITSTADTQTICSGEKAAMDFTSSLSGTTFSWTADDGTSGTGNVSEIKTNTGTTPITITYTITGVTSDGCSSRVRTCQVVVNPAVAVPTASVTTQPTCALATGTITITAPVGAGYTYSVDGTNYQSGTTFSGLGTGSYNVTVKNSDGCISAATALTINAQPLTPPVATASVTTQPTCALATGTITVTAPVGAGYTYSVDGTNYQPGTTFSGLATGSYNVTVKNSDGCTSAATALTINAQPLTPPVATASVTTQPTCALATGTIIVTAPVGAGYTYSVDGTNYQSGTTFSNLATGSYNVTVKNSDGCTSAATALTINAQPLTPALPLLGAVKQPTCSVSTGSFTISNYDASFTYAATPSAGVTILGNTITAPSGTYQVTATLGACTSDASSNVTIYAQPLPPTVTVSPVDPLCVNSIPAQLTGTPVGGIFSGTGINIAGLFSPAVAGLGNHTITYTYTNQYGCSAVATTSVQVIAAPSLSVTPATQTICSGSQATITASGDNGGTVNWTSNYFGLSGTGTIFNTGALFNKGALPLIFTLNAAVISGNCTDNANATITVLPEPRVIVVPNSAVVCSYETPKFTLHSVLTGTTINWQLVNNTDSSIVSSGTGSDNITLFSAPVPAGSYTLKVTGTKDGCSSAVVNVPLIVN